MNDRYLYRAKRKNWRELPEEKWWVEGNLVWSDDADDDYKAIIIPTTGSNMFTKGGSGGDLGFEKWYRVDPSTICKCTGLKDKNGKLIWENDIMVAHLDDSFPEDATYTRVVWDNNGFCTKEQGSDDISLLDKFDQEYFEVCGNRFDNPELLEVEE